MGLGNIPPGSEKTRIRVLLIFTEENNEFVSICLILNKNAKYFIVLL